MDQPRHVEQRKTVAPMFLPTNLDQLAVTDPRSAGEMLDNLPRNETFNWVEQVSIELTTQMLATLFDFPLEERRKLTRWSDVATALPATSGIVAIGRAARQAELQECARIFRRLWNERINASRRGPICCR